MYPLQNWWRQGSECISGRMFPLYISQINHNTCYQIFLYHFIICFMFSVDAGDFQFETSNYRWRRRQPFVLVRQWFQVLKILRTCKFLAVIQTLFTTITPHETVFVKLSIPFAADEISNCMQEKEFTNVKAAVELADNPNFHFLKDWDLFGPFFIWQLKLYSIPLLPRTDLRYVESYRFRQ